MATSAAAALPLGYYLLRSHIDPIWTLAGKVDFGVIPVLSVAAVLISVGLRALLAYRVRPDSFQDVAVGVWPRGSRALRFHLGDPCRHVSPPFAGGVEHPFRHPGSVRVQRLSLGLAAAAAVTMRWCWCPVDVPAGAQNLNAARSVGSATLGPTPAFGYGGEQSAHDDLLSRAAYSPPSISVRRCPVSLEDARGSRSISWTPDSVNRVEQVEALFAGRLSETEAAHLVRSSGPRSLLSDRNHPADLALQLPSTVAPPVPSAVPRPTGSSSLERPDRADGQGTERRPPLC